MTDKDEPKKDQPKPKLVNPEPEPGPVTIPSCGRCGKPMTQCKCTENDLIK